ncbi:hypothetical protein GTV32_18005 [Gordonia sp. SID5947]|uniref:hypothetical protein n=1 Tax=Gordonia sp. SID5947 TaxID=2690315 RepID=UPI00136E584C|nr:hypothetical protein [Gordonia sp. SID5947]MYR08078.1 hypothetical protein [Gordonia sp. SID5947]
MTVYNPDAPPSDELIDAERRRHERKSAKSGRAAMAEYNRGTAARNSNAMMTREVEKWNTGRRAAQAAQPVGPRVDPHPPVPLLSEAGEIGQRVAELIRLDRLDGALTRSLARITDENREIEAEAAAYALRTRLSEAAAALIDATSRKEKAPEVLRALVDEHHDRERLVVPLEIDKGLRAAIESEVCQRAAGSVRGVLDEIDTAVLDEADAVLADAVQAHERLSLAGVGVDVTLDQAVDGDDDGVLSAVRLWRSAVARWSDVQSVRMWCAAAIDRGFEVRTTGVSVVRPPKVRGGQFLTEAEARKHNSPQAEARTQGSSCWQGSAPSWLAGRTEHEVLRWFVGLDAKQRPNPRGVADLDTNKGA